MVISGKDLKRRLGLRLKRDHYRMNKIEHEIVSPGEARRGGAHAHKTETDKIIESMRDQLARSQAEFENFRKRVRRDLQQQIQMANQDLLEQILPVLDNFDRALTTPGDSVDALLNGMRMVQKQLLEILCRSGLEHIEAVGQPFDPNVHEAVGVDPSGEHPDNHVSAVLQEGYKLKGRLVRPAMVRVSKS